jgi:hypothetical protein
MNQAQAQAAVKQYGSQNKVCAALHISRRRFGEVLRGERESMQVAQAPVGTGARIVCDTVKPSSVRGISLVGDVRVSDHKPNDSIKRMLYGLKRGMAFPVEQMAAQWGVSSENIRKKARELECLKYVEVSPADGWVHCVMHPDTAEDLRKAAKE